MQGESLFGGDSFETYKQELVQGDPLETNTRLSISCGSKWNF